MHPKKMGVSLVEITAAVVILGILGAFAVPHFNNMSSESAQAAVRSVAGTIESGAARNHAIDIAVEEGLTTAVTDPFTNINNCQDGAQLLTSNKLPDGYSILSAEVSDQAAVTCTLFGKGGKQASFVVIGASGGTDRR